MNKIYFESNTFWLLRDYPEELDFKALSKDKVFGDYKFYTGYKNSDIQKQYDDQLKACIAAKTKIDNPELVFSWVTTTDTSWYYKGSILKDGSIFDVPDGVEFEGKLVWVPEELKTIEVIHLKLKEVKPAETQYDLWAEVVTYICNKSGSVSELKSKFTITRNKDKNVGN